MICDNDNIIQCIQKIDNNNSIHIKMTNVKQLLLKHTLTPQERTAIYRYITLFIDYNQQVIQNGTNFYNLEKTYQVYILSLEKILQHHHIINNIDQQYAIRIIDQNINVFMTTKFVFFVTAARTGMDIMYILTIYHIVTRIAYGGLPSANVLFPEILLFSDIAKIYNLWKQCWLYLRHPICRIIATAGIVYSHRRLDLLKYKRNIIIDDMNKKNTITKKVFIINSIKISDIYLVVVILILIFEMIYI